MDFYSIRERSAKNGVIEVWPDFRVCRSKDLMIRGKSFYAIWDEAKGLWSTDEYDVQRLIDEDLSKYKKELSKRTDGVIQVKYLGDFSSSSWLTFRNYVTHLSDSAHQLDESLTFSNSEVTKSDYVSKRLPYPLKEGKAAAWNSIMSILYSEENRAKIEWAIGSIISGDSKKIQKFVVLYGSAGTGKSTVLNIVQKMFDGYYTTFEAKALTSSSNAFATEVFKGNPLVAIQHDGDLSRIEDNTKLNSIVSHEDMTMNEKYKPSYMSRINAFLFMGTNKPVKITDSKSGIIRRLIDVQPTGEKLPPEVYHNLYSQIDFELGEIAHLCLERYLSMGKDYYSGYVPLEMMLQTDVFFNFIEANYDIFKSQDGVSLNQAHEMYKVWCEESDIEFRMPKYKLREELKNYFSEFEDRAVVKGERLRSWYSGFKGAHFKVVSTEESPKFILAMESTTSLLDDILAKQPAQLANRYDTPSRKWAEVTTLLSDIDTTKIHYVKPPSNHIVIDFDLKDASGEKSLTRNKEAAALWPPTYAELSKSGNGVHLHYIYEGDVETLSRIYDEGIEIKVFLGDSSLRRKLNLCNDIPIAKISSGLPLKEKKLLDSGKVASEVGLRDLVTRALAKEFHAGTKPSVDFIHKIFEDAYASGTEYDLTDMRSKILAFANNSTNQSLYCVRTVASMKFKSEEKVSYVEPKDETLTFFDVEVFPNLFVVCWKYRGTDQVVKMINPSAKDIEGLMMMKLVGFNCRRYDNHILYARFLGYTNEELYNLSQKIINGSSSVFFGNGWDLSYADIYDFSSKKQGLKKFQIELGLNHQELGLPWDQPVPDEMVAEVVSYCANDVETTEAVFESRKEDFVARQILSDLSGLPVNSTTQQHTSKILFGEDRKPQSKFVYTNLSEMFPGYTYDKGESRYRGEVTGEGGYVYAEPGMYKDVALLDVASMHPTSIEALELFGEYTKNFSALKQARLAIKHGDYESAGKMLGGKLAAHLGDPEEAEALSYALKIVINIVYGLTAAKFDNSFRDPRNIDNIVAKRGALFMVDLKHAVQEKGFTVAHIKTDSIKIPDATPEIIDFVMEFGEKYGYTFEHEATYEKLCLVNDAVYIAKTKAGRRPSKWVSVGAQFAEPFVFKTLFSKEDIVFEDLCQTKQVTTAMYLEFSDDDEAMALVEPRLHFIGKAGLFTPVTEKGGRLVREKDGVYHSVVGTKDHLWLESDMVRSLKMEDKVDMSYFNNMVDKAVEAVSKQGDLEWLTS